MTVNDLIAALVDELAEELDAEPLGESFTLAPLWLDLCRLAGEEPPAFLTALVDGPALVAAYRGEGRRGPGEGEPTSTPGRSHSHRRCQAPGGPPSVAPAIDLRHRGAGRRGRPRHHQEMRP